MVPYIACRVTTNLAAHLYVPVFAYMNKIDETPSSPHESTGIWMHKFNHVEAVEMPSYRLHPEKQLPSEHWELRETWMFFLTDFFHHFKCFTNHSDAERHKAMISVNQWPSYLKLAWTKSTVAHCVCGWKKTKRLMCCDGKPGRQRRLRFDEKASVLLMVVGMRSVLVCMCVDNDYKPSMPLSSAV